MVTPHVWCYVALSDILVLGAVRERIEQYGVLLLCVERHEDGAGGVVDVVLGFLGGPSHVIPIVECGRIDAMLRGPPDVSESCSLEFRPQGEESVWTLKLDLVHRLSDGMLSAHVAVLDEQLSPVARGAGLLDVSSG